MARPVVVAPPERGNDQRPDRVPAERDPSTAAHAGIDLFGRNSPLPLDAQGASKPPTPPHGDRQRLTIARPHPAQTGIDPIPFWHRLRPPRPCGDRPTSREPSTAGAPGINPPTTSRLEPGSDRPVCAGIDRTGLPRNRNRQSRTAAAPRARGDRPYYYEGFEPRPRTPRVRGSARLSDHWTAIPDRGRGSTPAGTRDGPHERSAFSQPPRHRGDQPELLVPDDKPDAPARAGMNPRPA